MGLVDSILETVDGVRKTGENIATIASMLQFILLALVVLIIVLIIKTIKDKKSRNTTVERKIVYYNNDMNKNIQPQNNSSAMHIPNNLYNNQIPLQNTNYDNKIVLVGVSGKYAGQKFEFFNNLVLGRDATKVNLIFAPDTRGVSSMHCRISKENGQIYIVDYSSSFGTFVNGSKIEPQKPYNLNSGDSFYLGFPDNTFTLLQ